MGVGVVVIYSCPTQLISFEIEIYFCEHEYMNMRPPIIDLPVTLLVSVMVFILFHVSVK